STDFLRGILREAGIIVRSRQECNQIANDLRCRLSECGDPSPLSDDPGASLTIGEGGDAAAADCHASGAASAVRSQSGDKSPHSKDARDPQICCSRPLQPRSGPRV
ncbi:MAG: hypothetical protein DWQ29_00240, partial [Planctomycetota bacterium]